MPEQRPPRRAGPPPFRPRFTISLVYLVGFFFVFSFLQILPDLIGLLSEMQPGPAQERAAAALARDGVRPLVSMLLSVAATGLGAYLRVLPGLRTD
jgi:hypothetical protein